MPCLVKRNPRTAWRRYEDSTLVITPDDRRVHTLNATGTFIWETLGEEGLESDALLRKMAERFDAPEQTLRQDMAAFIRELEGKGALMQEKCGK
jgi:hypothetical protein